MTDQKLMAFWGYDRFPYTLYSEVESFDSKPMVVKVKGFGGSFFKYKYLAPLDLGKQIAEELDSLEKEFKRETTTVSLKYHQELAKLAEKYGIPIPK